MSESFPASDSGVEMAKFSALRRKAGVSIPEVARLAGRNERTVYRWERGETVPKASVLEELRRRGMAEEGQASYGAENFRFIDLFAGIGGLRRAFDTIGGKCVFTCEWDEFCQETYKANYPNDQHSIAGDIRTVKAEEIPEHDVLVAGFPCQPFSIAGVSKKNALGQPHGFRCDTQGTLFFEVARIIDHHRPKAFLLENVKNLVSHDRGRTYEVIHRTLTEELGYHVEAKVLNARPYAPQHRERIFIVGFRDKVDFSFDKLAPPPSSAWPTLRGVLHPEDGTEPIEARFNGGPNGEVALKYTLTPHLWQYLQDYAAKHKEKGNGFGFGIVSQESEWARTLSARYYKDGSEILVRQKNKTPRRLTPRECARLMGFDPLLGSPGDHEIREGNRQRFKIKVSDTQAYKQFGNSVVPPVAEAVAKLMQPFIATSEAEPARKQANGRHR